jgi:hypothetical protein
MVSAPRLARPDVVHSAISVKPAGKNRFHRVVIIDKTPHGACHGAGDNLTRHEKMPQIHRFGGFRSQNAGRFDGVHRQALPSPPQP